MSVALGYSVATVSEWRRTGKGAYVGYMALKGLLASSSDSPVILPGEAPFTNDELRKIAAWAAKCGDMDLTIKAAKLVKENES